MVAYDPLQTSDKKSGAVLFAVIGAKLSEGLNFSDDLARAVVVIGLPFPNKNSPELQERMRYANQIASRSEIRRPAGGKDAATEMYENMCMNAVNQSIGEPDGCVIGKPTKRCQRPSYPTPWRLGFPCPYR